MIYLARSKQHRLLSRSARALLLAVWLSPLVIPCSSYSQSRSSANFSTLSQQADQARDANDLEKATRLYKQALALRPQWADGWWSLGTIYYDQSLYTDAAHAFQRLVAIAPTNGTAHAMLGLCQFELGQDKDALKNIEAGRRLGLHSDPQLRAVVFYHAGLLFLRQHKFSSAEDVLTVLARGGVDDPSAQLALGMSVLLVAPGNEAPEGSIGREVLMNAGRAEALAARKKFEEAKKLYASVLEKAPDFPNLHYAYGRFLLEVQETDEALNQFQLDLRDNPARVQSYLEIAAVNYRVNSAAGLESAKKGVVLAPQLPFGHYLLGLLYLDTGAYDESIRELEIAKKSYLDKAEVYFALGNAYAKAGRKESAAQARATFVRLNAQKKRDDEPRTYGERQSLKLGQQDSRASEDAAPHD